MLSWGARARDGWLARRETHVVLAAVLGVRHEGVLLAGETVGVAAAATLLSCLAPEPVEVRHGGWTGLREARVVTVTQCEGRAVPEHRNDAVGGGGTVKEAPRTVSTGVAGYAVICQGIEHIACTTLQ